MEHLMQQNGKMNNENFYEYMGNVFYKQILAENTNFAVISFVDGHKTLFIFETSEFC